MPLPAGVGSPNTPSCIAYVRTCSRVLIFASTYPCQRADPAKKKYSGGPTPLKLQALRSCGFGPGLSLCPYVRISPFLLAKPNCAAAPRNLPPIAAPGPHSDRAKVSLLLLRHSRCFLTRVGQRRWKERPPATLRVPPSQNPPPAHVMSNRLPWSLIARRCRPTPVFLSPPHRGGPSHPSRYLFLNRRSLLRSVSVPSSDISTLFPVDSFQLRRVPCNL